MRNTIPMNSKQGCQLGGLSPRFRGKSWVIGFWGQSIFGEILRGAILNMYGFLLNEMPLICINIEINYVAKNNRNLKLLNRFKCLVGAGFRFTPLHFLNRSNVMDVVLWMCVCFSIRLREDGNPDFHYE